MAYTLLGTHSRVHPRLSLNALTEPRGRRHQVVHPFDLREFGWYKHTNLPTSKDCTVERI